MNTEKKIAGSQRIAWPQEINPEDYPVHSYNQLYIEADPASIWKILVNAKSWPIWYKNSKSVSFESAEDSLSPNTRFTWRTFGLRVRSEVVVFNPFIDLGWSAREFGGHGFHGWKIIPKDNGCLVVTEEVQKGFGPMLIGKLIEKNLQKQHQIWLEGIARQLN